MPKCTAEICIEPNSSNLQTKHCKKLWTNFTIFICKTAISDVSECQTIAIKWQLHRLPLLHSKIHQTFIESKWIFSFNLKVQVEVCKVKAWNAETLHARMSIIMPQKMEQHWQLLHAFVMSVSQLQMDLIWHTQRLTLFMKTNFSSKMNTKIWKLNWSCTQSMIQMSSIVFTVSNDCMVLLVWHHYHFKVENKNSRICWNGSNKLFSMNQSSNDCHVLWMGFHSKAKNAKHFLIFKKQMALAIELESLTHQKFAKQSMLVAFILLSRNCYFQKGQFCISVWMKVESNVLSFGEMSCSTKIKIKSRKQKFQMSAMMLWISWMTNATNWKTPTFKGEVWLKHSTNEVETKVSIDGNVFLCHRKCWPTWQIC